MKLSRLLIPELPEHPTVRFHGQVRRGEIGPNANLIMQCHERKTMMTIRDAPINQFILDDQLIDFLSLGPFYVVQLID